MKRSNCLLGFTIGMALLAAPYGAGFAAGNTTAGYQALSNGINEALAKQSGSTVTPQFSGSGCIDYFPLSVDNVQGLTATLEVSNLSDNSGSFNICAIPAHTTEYACRGQVSLGPRDAKFYTMPQLFSEFSHAVGQISVSANGNSIGASQLIMFGPDGSVVSIINPTEFCN